MRHMTLLLLAALVGTLVFAQNASSALAEGPLTSDEGTPAPTESASPQNTASATQKILTAPPSSEFNPLQLGFGKGISVAQEIRKKIRERIDGGKKFIEDSHLRSGCLSQEDVLTIKETCFLPLYYLFTRHVKMQVYVKVISVSLIRNRSHICGFNLRQEVDGALPQVNDWRFIPSSGLKLQDENSRTIKGGGWALPRPHF